MVFLVDEKSADVAQIAATRSRPRRKAAGCRDQRPSKEGDVRVTTAFNVLRHTPTIHRRHQRVTHGISCVPDDRTMRMTRIPARLPAEDAFIRLRPTALSSFLLCTLVLALLRILLAA